MPETNEGLSKYMMIFVTGFISLIVGVGGGLILNKLTDKKAILEYQVSQSEVFTGPTRNIAILAIEVENRGNKMLEDFFCHIDFPTAMLLEHKCTGIPLKALNMVTDTNLLEVTSPYLNPKEKVSFQFLLGLSGKNLSEPSIEIRSKGIVGEIRKHSKNDNTPKPFLISLTTALLALLSVVVMMQTLRRKTFLFSSKHSDDQRDVVSYICLKNGLNEEAELAIQSNRRMSYWALSDLIANRCIATDQNEIIQKGFSALEDLIEYAQIAPSSVDIIRLNMAKLADKLGKVDVSKGLINKLKGKHDKVIEKRIKIDKQLANIQI